MAVTLDKTDSTLNLSLAEDLLTATPLVSGNLSQLWSGVRANSCVSSGKVFFVVNVVNELSDDCEGVRPEALIGVSARATNVSHLGCGSSWAYAHGSADAHRVQCEACQMDTGAGGPQAQSHTARTADGQPQGAPQQAAQGVPRAAGAQHAGGCMLTSQGCARLAVSCKQE